RCVAFTIGEVVTGKAAPGNVGARAVRNEEQTYPRRNLEDFQRVQFKKEENEVQMRVWRKDQIVWKGDCAVKDGKIEIREDCNWHAKDAKKAARMWRWCKKALVAPPGASEQPWEISTTYPEGREICGCGVVK
ncbi:hypothetical protein RUND412_006065, partial [Rhizina undulata]